MNDTPTDKQISWIEWKLFRTSSQSAKSLTAKFPGLEPKVDRRAQFFNIWVRENLTTAQTSYLIQLIEGYNYVALERFLKQQGFKFI